MLISACALLSCGHYGRCAFSRNDEADNCISKGISHFVQENFDAAIAEFSQAIAINPKATNAYYQRAKVYENKDNFDEAIADYSRAIKIDPEYSQAYYYRGVLYQQKGLLEPAIADYTKIIEIKSSATTLVANAYNNRGLIYDKNGEYNLALSDFSRAIELLPDQINAYYNRGITYLNKKAYSSAKADFEKEAQIHPELSLANRYKSALTHFVKGEFQEAYIDILTLEEIGEKINPEFIEDVKNRLQKN